MSRYHNLLSVINHLYILPRIIILSLLHDVRSKNLSLVVIISLTWINSTVHKDWISPETSVTTGNYGNKNWCWTATEKNKKSDEFKSSILITCIGLRGRKVYNTFVFDDDSMKMNFNNILQQFDDYCSHQKMWLSSDTNVSCIDS